jgi:CPA2 family monovalent cation:H+ antiporter-2
MEHHAGLPFLRETLLFLTLAGILIPFLQRFKINQVLGFLTIGVIFGPFGLPLFSEQFPWLKFIAFTGDAEVQSLAELGVMFLMFLIGLELSPERLWSLRRWVFLGGSAQVVLTALLTGTIAYFFGNRLEIAILLGLVFSLSSTAIVMQLLTQKHELPTPMGQASFSMLMMQDFVVVPLLIFVDLLGQKTTENLGVVVAMTLLKSIVAVLFIFLVGRRIVAPIFRFFAKQRQPEVFMALTLLVALGISAATAAVGLSLALGAFLAGLLLAETEYRHEVEVTIEPFKGLLMGLFFMSVGMGINLAAFFQNYYWIMLSVFGLILIKAVVICLIMRRGRLSWGKSIEGGFLLSQGSEFAFVVIGVSVTTQILPSSLAQFMLLVVSVSLLLTPFFARFGQYLGVLVDAKFDAEHRQAYDALPKTLDAHIVIAGFGRVGQLLADILEKQGVAYVAIEHDAHVVAHWRKLGRAVVYGNASRPELLLKMHMQGAVAFIVTMDQPAAAMHAVLTARSEYPDLPIFARSRDEIHALELRSAGATAVVPETLEAGLQLSSFALNALMLSELEISHILSSERELRVSRVSTAKNKRKASDRKADN